MTLAQKTVHFGSNDRPFTLTLAQMTVRSLSRLKLSGRPLLRFYISFLIVHFDANDRSVWLKNEKNTRNDKTMAYLTLLLITFNSKVK